MEHDARSGEIHALAHEQSRKHMLETLRRYGIRDERTIGLMERIPRHLFVPDNCQRHAYADEPLPIGYGQTISQPYIVALMTQLLELSGKEKVLEIGTGSGFQTAMLASLAKEVYTIERIESLSLQAQKRLEELDYNNISCIVADGSLGWTTAAPFDAILSAAAAPALPEPWFQQIKDGGRIVVPVGGQCNQTLMLYRKSQGKLLETVICKCVFVPLTGKFGLVDAE